MEPGFRRRGTIALFFAVFLLFTLSGSREQPWADARPVWEVADALARRGEINIRTTWPVDLPRGRNGKIYAVAPIVQSLVHLPGAAARVLLGRLAPRTAPHSLSLFSHLAPALLGALTCVLFFQLCRERFGASLRAALLATAALALGTMVWIYARTPYAEILQAAGFTGFYAALLRLGEARDRRAALAVGAWAGLLVATKPVYLLVLPGAAGWLWWTLRAQPRVLVRLLAWTAAAMVPFAALLLGYNQARWGSVLISGYGLEAAGDPTRVSPYGENVLVGLFGLFLSPGKSVFLFCPPLVLAAAAMPRFFRRSRPACWALLLTVGPVVLLCSRLLVWAGDYAWGPRYLVFAVPVAMLPLAGLFDDLSARAAAGLRRRARVAQLGVAAVLACGAVVQVLGVSFFWDHHIRITMDVRSHWLGQPNRAGAFVPARDGLCGACFEDMHGLEWLPPFSALAGHRWLLRHVPFGDGWEAAQEDAPWRRYTRIALPPADGYRAARLDWWFLELEPVDRAVAVTLLAALAAGLAAALVVLGRELRRARPADAHLAADT
jgi:hypothetical protein